MSLILEFILFFFIWMSVIFILFNEVLDIIFVIYIMCMIFYLLKNNYVSNECIINWK